MINNRQNGRRRGRGSGAPRPNGSGPDRGNRLDNRARGNASQLHEKYKTLARDAQMQGDRVMTEYYLQFADHYFRILSESRARFDEQRRPQGQDDYDDGEGAGQGGDEDQFDEPRYEQQPRGGGEYRQDQGGQDQPRQNQGRQDSGRQDSGRQDQGRQDQQRDASRGSQRSEPRADDRDVREPRPHREEREGRPERNYQDRPRRDANSNRDAGEAGEPAPRIEIDRLPPALSVDAGEAQGDSGEERPRVRRGRRPRAETTEEVAEPRPDAA